MCQRISQPPVALWPKIEEQLRIDFNYNVNPDGFHVPSQTIATRDPVIAIAQSKIQERPGIMLVQTDWGVQIKDQLVYNARIETAPSKLSWADGFQFHRMLVPVLSFYELDSNTKRTFECYKYNDELFMLGGIGVAVEGSPLRHLVICTQESFPEVARHHRRQPVIIAPQYFDEWLNNNYDPASIISKVTRQSFPIQLREAA